MIVKLLTEHHLEFLSLKGGCRGLSESTHVKNNIVGNLMPRLIYMHYTAILSLCVSSRVCNVPVSCKAFKLAPMLYLHCIMCINVKMPTIVGILTLMSMITFMLSWIEFYNLGAKTQYGASYFLFDLIFYVPSCSRTQRSDTRTCGPSFSSQALFDVNWLFTSHQQSFS